MTKAGKVQLPKCVGFTNGIGNDSPLIIRVTGFRSWISGTVFKLTLDKFDNPPIQNLFGTPMDISMTLVDKTNGQK